MLLGLLSVIDVLLKSMYELVVLLFVVLVLGFELVDVFEGVVEFLSLYRVAMWGIYFLQ